MIWKSDQDDADDENANDKTGPVPIKHEQERHEENAENVVQSDVQPRSKLREHLPATSHQAVECIKTLGTVHKEEIREKVVRVLDDVDQKACAVE